jgi:K+-transporting ATPase ATPase C chain
VARARHLEFARVEALIKAHERERLFGLIGERRINVLELNLALDEMH